jgi:aminoglycoside/choline kinase family phosphotransferase
MSDPSVTPTPSRKLPLVDHPDKITPEWLSQLLAMNGIEASIKQFRHSPVGTGQMADNYRLHLEYGDKPADAPDTLVVKVSSSNPTSRGAGASGGYATEVKFYLDLARELAIRTPRCYHGDISDDRDEFVLVLEDLAPAEQGDQIRGCTAEQAELALTNLAGLHGSSWCDDTLDRHDWLSRVTPDVAKLFTNILVPSTEGFIERYGARLHADDVDVLRKFASAAEGWLVGRPKIFAPVHGDYRLDNLMFGTAKGGAPVAAVDWQTLSIGHPGRDVAYFLGNSLTPELRRANEESLVAAYHKALLGIGVSNYSPEQCFEDYRYGQFQGPLVTVLGAMAVIQTDRGDEMFMAMCSRSCQAIRDLDSIGLL